MMNVRNGKSINKKINKKNDNDNDNKMKSHLLFFSLSLFNLILRILRRYYVKRHEDYILTF